MDEIKYRTFTTDTKGRLRRADNYKITTATLKTCNGEFITAMAVAQGKHYVKLKGQMIALGRLQNMITGKSLAKRFIVFPEETVRNVLRRVIKFETVYMHSLKHIKPEDLR